MLTPAASASPTSSSTRDNRLSEDAKNESEAKSKIDIIYQRLKSGADFATVAREKSEDPSNIRGGDIGFATEDQLKQTGFPPELVDRFFTSMQAGDITPPLKFSNNNWYIFKLTSRQLQNENLTLESPNVRDQVKEILLNQHRQMLNAALLGVAINEAKIENNLALNMLNSPSNLSGLRPAQTGGPAAATAPAAGNSNAAAATSSSSAAPTQTNAAPGN
ncbi:MAG: peptidylprolyl isomerase [Pyrinomonadaceae bacterium]